MTTRTTSRPPCGSGRCGYCVCDPRACAADDSGGHCADWSCGSCLHGCPQDTCTPGQTTLPLTEGTSTLGTIGGIAAGAARRPRLLDLFCGVGGATRGYQQAGWHVTGVDLVERADYCGDDFVRSDAIAFALAHGHRFDAIHASAPCQTHSLLTRGNRGRGRTDHHLDLIPPTRAELHATGRPWVMENVVGSTLRPDLILCGLMFQLKVFRHRIFELHHITVPSPPHPTHRGHRVAGWRHGVRHHGDMVAVYGDGGGKGSTSTWQQAMGIDWTTDRQAIAQAIPPAYTHHIATHLPAPTPSDKPEPPQTSHRR